MMPLWKRFFAKIIGAYLVLNLFNSGPLQPDNAEERVIMLLTKVALAVLGVWMIVRGGQLRRGPGPTRPFRDGA